MSNLITFPYNNDNKYHPKFERISKDTIHISFIIEEVDEDLMQQFLINQRALFIYTTYVVFVLNDVKFEHYTNDGIYVNGCNITFTFTYK